MCYVPVYAGTESVTLTWNYDTPPTDLAEFELRVNGNNSTLISIDFETRTWVGDIEVVDGSNVLDLRAKDASGQVSVWSDPCAYNPVPGAPTNLNVNIN
jgi:hypothetical protein